MKVVINKCFGGFGLSHDAIRALIGKCDHVKLEEPSSYYGGPGSVYYEKNKNRLAPDAWRKDYERDLAHAAKGRNSYTHLFHDGKVVCDEHREQGRTCPALIAVIERMGAAADGSCAQLAVVEIPDGVTWEIDEYDGRESIHEAHRTWA